MDNLCNDLAGLVISEPGNGPKVVGLEAVACDITIRDFVAQLQLKQTYCNAQAKAVHCKYVFPINSQATVTGFAARLNGVVVRGQCKEKEEAKQKYEEAVKQKKTAALLEQDKADVFVCSIGNLDAGARCEIEVEITMTLPLEGKHTRLTLPTVVAPRYDPTPVLWDPFPGILSAPAAASTTAPRLAGTDTPYKLMVKADITMPSQIREISSPSHPITVRNEDPKRATVTLGQREVSLNKDLVILIEQAEPYATRAVIEHDPVHKTNALQVTFCPMPASLADAMDLRCEFLFLIDQSGSMSGSPIASVRETLQLLLRSMPTGARFNIIGFGTSFQKLWPTAREYSDATIAEAAAHAAKLDATLGGTELLPALKNIFATPGDPNCPRQLFVLTDGEVSNTNEVVSEVKEHAHQCRVFTFGIGRSASTALVNGIAEAGTGQSEFIHENEKISDKVLRQLQRALQPALTNVQVDWSPLQGKKEAGSGKPEFRVMQAPQQPPPFFAQSRYFLYALDLPPLDRMPAEWELTIRATSNRDVEGSDCVTIKVPIRCDEKNCPPAVGCMVHKLAARTRIRELEMLPERMMHSKHNHGMARTQLSTPWNCDGCSKNSADPTITKRWRCLDGCDFDLCNICWRKEIPRDEPETEIVGLGTRYGVASKHTSFVAIHETLVPTGGATDVKTVEIPLSSRAESIDGGDVMMAYSRGGGPPPGALAMPMSLNRRAMSFGGASAAAAAAVPCAASASSNSSFDMFDFADSQLEKQCSLERLQCDSKPAKSRGLSGMVGSLFQRAKKSMSRSAAPAAASNSDADEDDDADMAAADDHAIFGKSKGKKSASRGGRKGAAADEAKTKAAEAAVVLPADMRALLMALIAAQSADGSWATADAIVRLLGNGKLLGSNGSGAVADYTKIIAQLRAAQAGRKGSEAEAVIATSLALCLLLRLFAKDKNEWAMIDAKARRFLAKQTKTAGDTASFVTQCASAFTI